MFFWNKICGFITIFFICSLSVGAQGLSSNKTLTTQLLPNQLSKSINNFLNRDAEKISQPLSVIPGDYYTQHFGIMCKKELAVEKATKIPFRFRLGSLKQCDYLEGKK